ncbi:hypothetical protein BDZ89DRAFT_1057577 [Hymenopellis radicata]|nr:hypothetical protein BDZ89DRAFT_1057577 [Hymenopellis radicata]
MPITIRGEVILPKHDPSKGDYAAPTGQSNLVLRTCDNDGCKNYKGLANCARSDWAHHKAFCAIASRPKRQVKGFDGEPPLRRHLRHWTSRFDNSLRLAAIVALELGTHPDNIDKVGLIVTLRPRPHANSGSRFSFVAAAVHPLDFIEGFLKQSPDGEEMLRLHHDERKALMERTGGEDDFVACLVYSANDGPTPLLARPWRRVRFKPLGVNRGVAQSEQLKGRGYLDWYRDLSYHIEMDIPARTIASN